MKPTNEDRRTKRLRQLNERLDRNLAKGFLSVKECREVLSDVVRRNGMENTLKAIRERN